MATENIELRIKTAVEAAESAKTLGELRSSMKELQSLSLEVGENGKGFKGLQGALAQSKDRVDDLKDSVTTLRGSGVEKLSASFNLFKDSLINADYGKAKIAFQGIGTAMKAIPIFLIIEGIRYLIENFEKLKSSGGLLGKALTAIGDVIGGLIQGLKDFSDWIGITNFAIEDKAAKTVEAAKTEQTAVTDRYDAEIKLAQAAGKSTVELEKLKQQAVIDSADIQIKAITDVVRVNGEVTEEQIKQLNELKKQRQTAELEQKAIELKAAEEEKKRLKELAKTNKEAKDRRDEENKKKVEATQKLNDQIRQIEISLIEDVEERRIKQLTFEAELKKREINNSIADEKVKTEAILEVEKQLQTNIIAVQKEGRDKRKEEDKKAQEQATKDAEELISVMLREQLAAAELNKIKNQGDLEAQLAYLEEKKNQELANTELTESEKLLILEDYSEKARQVRLTAAENEVKIGQEVTTALQGLSDLVFTIKSSNLKKGSKEEEENAKKQFKINKALALTGAILSTAQAAIKSLSQSPLAIGPVPSPIGIASLAAVVLTGAASIAKIASTQYQGGSSGSGGGASAGLPSVGSVQSVSSPSVGPSGESTLFNQSLVNQPGNSNQGNSPNGSQQSGVKVMVTETDITSTQNKVRVIENQAKF